MLAQMAIVKGLFAIRRGKKEKHDGMLHLFYFARAHGVIYIIYIGVFARWAKVSAWGAAWCFFGGGGFLFCLNERLSGIKCA